MSINKKLESDVKISYFISSLLYTDRFERPGKKTINSGLGLSKQTHSMQNVIGISIYKTFLDIIICFNR
jgi:hypothetical protein